MIFKQPLVERLPYQTPNRPKDITLSRSENGRLTTSPDCGRLTTPVQEQGQLESPHVFLSPVDKGIYVINSTLDSSQVSQTTHTILNSQYLDLHWEILEYKVFQLKRK